MANEYKTMTLSECAKYDKMTGARDRLTGWGKICLARQQKGISRRIKILRKKGKAV